jgi:hypothetical protein
LSWRDVLPSFGLRPFVGPPAQILLLTAGYLGVGLVAFAIWRLSGNDVWIEGFFQIPGALILVWLAATALLFTARICRRFFPGEPMRSAWQLIAFSAASELAGSILTQIFGTKSRLNPLTYLPGGAGPVSVLRSVGVILDGPLRFALLAAALFLILRLYRRSGFLGQYAPLDWAALAGFGFYVVREAMQVMAAHRQGKQFSLAEILNFPADPLLWVLLAQALRLFRSVRKMGAGWIGNCYGAFSAGIFLILVGDLAIWATNWGYLPWPWSAVGWYVWVPASAAFALAPAYQWEAMRHAESSGAPNPLKV